jgi:hypoxanthine phosphoribosyltransferase
LSNLEMLYSEQEISEAVHRLAREIKAEYADKNPVIVGVLKGVFVFAADLIRLLDFPLEIEFVVLSSYGPGRKVSSGEVRMVKPPHISLKNRHVLVLEDIIDEGRTIDFFLHYLERKSPASVRVCAMFNKPSKRKIAVKVDYFGLTVPDAFLVGYGLDFDEKYRYLPALYKLEE